MTASAQERTYLAPTFGSLLRAELLRVRSRRFVRWGVVVLLLVMVLVAVVYFRTTAPYTQAEVDAVLATCSQEGFGGAGAPSGDAAGPGPCDVRDAVSADLFPGDPPAYRAEVAEWATAVGVAVAAFGFLLGATSGGADWAQRTMPALLFWEPRRLRVYAAKLLSLVLAVTALFVVAQLVWLLLSAPTYVAHGVRDDGTGPLTDAVLFGLGTTWLVAVVFASVSFGVACLTRSTGAALGAGFVYLAVLETAVGQLYSRAQEWLVMVNLAALLTPGGLDEDAFTVTPLRAAVVLVAYAAVVNAAAATLFHRRDIT